MNIEQALLFGKKKLKQYDIESYTIDATLLLMKAMSFTKVQIYTNNHVIFWMDSFSHIIHLFLLINNFTLFKDNANSISLFFQFGNIFII